MDYPTMALCSKWIPDLGRLWIPDFRTTADRPNKQLSPSTIGRINQLIKNYFTTSAFLSASLATAHVGNVVRQGSEQCSRSTIGSGSLLYRQTQILILKPWLRVIPRPLPSTSSWLYH